jgi:DNA-binding beta-propeller fold protein YncE
VQSFVFGTDGNLYIASWTSNGVFRFNGTNGQFLNAFVAPASGGLSQPGGLAFGPDGNLYVSSTATHTILRYDGHSGAFLGLFATHPDLHFPTSLVFIPPAPHLQVKHVASTVQITWPASNSPQNWTLLTQRNLASGQWLAVTNPAVLSGTNCVVSMRCEGISSLYRLEQR